MTAIKCLLYCTKEKPYLTKKVELGKYYCELKKGMSTLGYTTENELSEASLNGTVCCECDIDKVEIWNTEWYPKEKGDTYMDLSRPSIDEETGEYDFNNCEELYTNEDIKSIDDNAHILKKSCLTFDELGRYASGLDKSGGGDFYALYLSNVKAIEPFKIVDCVSIPTKSKHSKPLVKAPQNMQMALVGYAISNLTTDKYLVISVRPKYLCKILNGEKTIEVRRVITKELKELIK